MDDLRAADQARRQRREQDRAAEIYQEAARIFHEKGYEATSVSDIADAVRMTKAGLYYYIESKEDLLFRIINHGLDWLEREVIEPGREIGDPEERLRWLIQHHGQGLCQGSRVIPRLTEEVSSLSPKHQKHIIGRKRRYLEFVRETLEELKSEGKLRPIDTTVAAFALFGMLLWLPRWYQPDGRLNARQTVENLLNLFLSGAVISAKSERRTPKARDRSETACATQLKQK